MRFALGIPSLNGLRYDFKRKNISETKRLSLQSGAWRVLLQSAAYASTAQCLFIDSSSAARSECPIDNDTGTRLTPDSFARFATFSCFMSCTVISQDPHAMLFHKSNRFITAGATGCKNLNTAFVTHRCSFHALVMFTVFADNTVCCSKFMRSRPMRP